MTTTHVLTRSDADIAYDVHGPLPTVDGRPPLVLIGQPMDATGFAALVPHLADRTCVTYDPRGLGRSVRKDGRRDHVAQTQAEDVHALIAELGAGPVDLFASSGGAITALALVAAHPDDVRTLVAHEPPLLDLLPDAEAARRAKSTYQQAYAEKGWGAGMAAFIAMTSWSGPFTEEYFAQPLPDPAAFGLPTDDDGSRDDPLLSELSEGVIAYRPEIAALKAGPTRVVVAVGEESENLCTGRTAEALAAALGRPAAVFPSHHGGFAGPELGYPGQPEAFAVRLREVLGAE